MITIESLSEYLGLYSDTVDANAFSPYSPPTKNPVLDKRKSMKQYVKYMLNRTAKMFSYENLPRSIPALELESIMQVMGYAVICRVPNAPDNLVGMDYLPAGEHNMEPSGAGNSDNDTGGSGVDNSDDKITISPINDLYAFYAGLGGELDAYYRPTVAIVNNPYLKFDKSLTIGKDCAVIRNDSHFLGLMPMYWRYAAQMAENDISIRSAQINSRERSVIIADNQRAFDSAQEYLKKLEDGDLAAIMDTPLLGNSRVENGSPSAANTIIQLIELGQYLKASWFNEVGLNTSFNMKREYLSSEEIAVNTDVLMPLVDDMLECRQRGIEIVNSMFGTGIRVKKSSAWEHKDIQADSYTEGKEGEDNAADSDPGRADT